MDQGLGGGHVGIVGATRLRATPLHGFIDDPAIDALDLQLAPERPLAAWAGSIPGLNPGLGERRVIEDAKPDQPLDRAVDELRSITGLREAPPHLGDRTLPNLEEAQRRRQDDLRIIDLRMPSALVSERLAPCPRLSPIPVSHESPWYTTAGIRFRGELRSGFVPSRTWAGTIFRGPTGRIAPSTTWVGR